MMQTDTQFDEEKIKRYLYGEMSGEERDAMEDEFFESDELFLEIAETENLLVDLYARKKLSGAELQRFEKALEKSPERRTKAANAVALQTFIAEQRKPSEAAEPVAAGQTFWQKITGLFTIPTPAFGFSMAALLLLFVLATAFLLIDNRRKSGEIAELQNKGQTGWEQKQKELEEKLAAVNERVEDLQKQTEFQGAEGDRVFGELQNVAEEKARIEKELERLRQEKNVTPTPKQPVAPTIASFLLTPTFSTRGGSGGASRDLSIPRETRQISMRLVLPEELNKEDRLTVKLNGRTLVSNLPAQKSVQIKLSPDDISDGLNRLSVENAEGKEISKYIFNMRKK